MTNSKPTIIEEVNRLQSHLGKTATQSAFSAYKKAHNLPDKGMMRMPQMLEALRSFAAVKPGASVSTITPATAPRQASPAPVMSEPTITAPAAAVPQDSQRELTAQARVRASIRAGFAMERSGVGSSLPKTSFPSTKAEAQMSPEFAGLSGKELLQASIRSQLSRQRQAGSLPSVRLSSE